MSDAFARALEGEQLSEAEVTQMWAESTVWKVSPAWMAEIEAALDRDAEVPPGLKALVERARLEGWGG